LQLLQPLAPTEGHFLHGYEFQLKLMGSVKVRISPKRIEDNVPSPGGCPIPGPGH
jgi:hypothetical protein